MTEIIIQSMRTINSFLRLNRALTEDEYLLYQAALNFSATTLKSTTEILAEKEFDEHRDSDSDDCSEDS